MAMEMKKSMRSVLVIMYCIRFAAADPETSIVWSSCGDSGKSVYRNGDAFQLSLSKVLDSLVRNVNQSGFNTSSVVVEGQNSDSTIYGLLQCRGDLDSSDCKQCASTARANLILGCQNPSGFIQLDGCFLRYDNHNFYNDAESMHNTPLHVFCNLGNSSRPQQFTNDVKALVSDLNKKVVQSPKLFAADSVVVSSNLTDTIYSFAQCWRYMSPTSCAACLTFALQNMGLNMGLNIDRCPLGALGGQFGSENCYLRYEVYEIFNTSILSPPSGESPPSSESKRPRVRWIILGVVAVTLVLIASIGLWKWNIICACLKRRGERFLEPEVLNLQLNH